VVTAEIALCGGRKAVGKLCFSAVQNTQQTALKDIVGENLLVGEFSANTVIEILCADKPLSCEDALAEAGGVKLGVRIVISTCTAAAAVAVPEP